MPRKTVLIIASIVAVAVILSLRFLLVASVYSRQTLPTLSIDKVYNVTEVGQTFIVNVTLEDVPSTLGCSGWYVGFTWDPYEAVLTEALRHGPIDEPYAVLTEGPFLRSVGSTIFLINHYDNERGIAVVSAMLTDSKTNASGTGVILMMNFTTVHAGTTTIEPRSPIQSFNQSLVLDALRNPLEHIETEGLITEKTIEEPFSFLTVILFEIAMLLAVTVLIVIVLRRRSTEKSSNSVCVASGTCESEPNGSRVKIS